MLFLKKWLKRKTRENRPFGRHHFYLIFTLLWGGLLAVFALQFATYKPPLKNSLFKLHSTELGSDLKYISLSSIANAKASVFIASYGFSDPDLISLLEKQSKRNIPIRIVFDKAYPPAIHKENNLELIRDPKSGLMHRKIIIVDGHTILLGSTNSTEFSLKMHKNLIIHMEDEELARSIISTKLYETPQFSYIPIPEEKKIAFGQVSNLIDSAKNRIHLAMFTLTHNLLVEKLIDAHNRGVAVRVTIDPGMARGTCRKAIAKLKKANVPLFQHRSWSLFHHKCAWIDDVFVAGSANWTKSGFERNREYVIIFRQLSKVDLAQVNCFFTAISRHSKRLQISSQPVIRKSWRIPYFPPRFLSSCSWTPLVTSLCIYPFSKNLTQRNTYGLCFERCA